MSQNNTNLLAVALTRAVLARLTTKRSVWSNLWLARLLFTLDDNDRVNLGHSLIAQAHTVDAVILPTIEFISDTLVRCSSYGDCVDPWFDQFASLEEFLNVLRSD